MMTLQELVDSHGATIATLRQKLAQNEQEHNAIVASLIKEAGYLEGLQAAITALPMPVEKEPTDSGILGEKA